MKRVISAADGEPPARRAAGQGFACRKPRARYGAGGGQVAEWFKAAVLSRRRACPPETTPLGDNTAVPR